MKRLRATGFIATLFFVTSAVAQPDAYILNGSAQRNSCNCYTLTPAVNTQSGSVWNKNKIDLNSPFDFTFNVFLGCTDANGADGMVFILQPISTSVGTTGGGMGFEGIAPSVGIALDTWQNADNNDPAYDHISIQANGVLNHANDLAGPVQASPTNENIEDCQWHTFRIIWDPSTHLLRTFFDGFFRLEATVDMVATIFNNDPLVYWGFSAGTGGANNLQQFCTALNPEFNATTTTATSCLGEAITFSNTSTSFAPITNFFWSFGDGNTSTLANPPAHTYATAGVYQVKLAITGLDGCESDTMIKSIVVGDYPIANFEIYDTCSGTPPRVIDQSLVNVGSVSGWNWVLDGTPVSIASQPQLTGLTPGLHELRLDVASNHGCASAAPAIRTFTISPRPVISAQGENGCVNEPVSFSAQQTDNTTTVTQWNWQFGNNQASTQQNPQHTYTSQGMYDVSVSAQATNGCASDIIMLPVFINQAFANAGNDTMVVMDLPFRLNGSGGVQYSWSPATGLSNTITPDPVSILQDDITYTLTVTTPEGCTDDDNVHITVFKGSAIYVPNGFTPNNDGRNERLKPYYIGIVKLDYFTVFNRWGNTVFTTKDLGAGWDGTYKGALQQSGTYVWMLQATDFVGKVYKMKGTVTIIR